MGPASRAKKGKTDVQMVKKLEFLRPSSEIFNPVLNPKDEGTRFN
jgi:hypothetical protein